jgi:tetratricopeptide (TPR) repeat protein
MLSDANKLIRLAPLKNEGWSLRATYRTARKEFAAALPDIDEAIALSPTNGFLVNRRATILLGLGRTEDSLAAYQQAHALAPKSVGIAIRLGKALTQVGRHEEAQPLLDVAVDTDPTRSHARVARADLREAQGDIAGALIDLRAALAIALDKVKRSKTPDSPPMELRRRIEDLERRLTAPGEKSE